MALEESSFRRPASVPFKWELQPGIPKQPPVTHGPASTAAAPTLLLPPRLAVPPATAAAAAASRRVSDSSGALESRSSSCRRTLPPSAATLSPPPSRPSPSSTTRHRRSMSARFASSLVLPFTRPGRRWRHKCEEAGDGDDDVAFSALYGDKLIV